MLTPGPRTVLAEFPIAEGEPQELPQRTAEEMLGPALLPPAVDPPAVGSPAVEPPTGELMPGVADASPPAAPPQAALEPEGPVPRAAGGWARESGEAATGSLLPLLDENAPRSRNLELTAREADRHTRRGFELAGRGAYFSARAEFIMALRLVSQALDAERQTTRHSRALAAGLTALKEAGDFVPKGSKLEADLDLAALIGGHRTTILKDGPTEDLTPLVALQCYFTFAQQQLGGAGGKEVAASVALHGLGKLHEAAGRQTATIRAAGPKAMVFYQAALLVSPQNYVASNELGALLARAGRYAEAKTALEHSLSIHRQSAGWHNLAVVYGQLGRAELARRASRLAATARRAETARTGGPRQASPGQIQWVDAGAFARSFGPTPNAGPTPSSPTAPTERNLGKPRSPARQRLAESPPWNPLSKRN